jgi:hypothetical protein
MHRSTYRLSLMTTMQPAREHQVQSFRRIRLTSKDGAVPEAAGFEGPWQPSRCQGHPSPAVTFPRNARAISLGQGRKVVGRPAPAVVPVIPEPRHLQSGHHPVPA